MKTLMLCFASLMACASLAFAASGPLLVPDYDRDGVIGSTDYDRLNAGEQFTIWLNDDDDAAGVEADDGVGDTNSDLHDVPGGEDNDRDCEDDKVNGRCDLLDFFSVLIDVNGVDGWSNYDWKLISKSVNVVFTQLKAGKAGDFHTKEAKFFVDDETPLYEAPVVRLADEDEVALPDGFLKDGRGVIIVEGAALGDEGLTLRGERKGSDPVEVTLNLRVKNVEEMYGWMNLRGAQPSTSQPLNFSTSQSDKRHFVLVHGYNTNHEEARGNAAEFYKKLWQSGSDAMFTAVEWRGDQSQVKVDLLGVNFTPNYHVNVENAFLAARSFAEACAKLPGEKILVGHSLGNVLISSAIKDYGLDYTKYVMLNAAVAREAYDASAYDEAMIPTHWNDDMEGGLDRAARWYRNFADQMYDYGEYRRTLAWRGRFASLPRTVNYYSPTDNVLLNPDPSEKDPCEYEIDKVFQEYQKRIFGTNRQTTGFGFWSFSEKIKGTWVVDVINEAMTNLLDIAQADAYLREGGWGENGDYEEEQPFSPANTHFTPFLDERMMTSGTLNLLPAEAEHLRAQHLADAIPAESFAAGANEVATLENVNLESFIGENPDWPVYEGDEERTNEWRHSTFREVAFYHTSKLYAELAKIGSQRIILDTDLGSSMDDLFTVDLAARMHKAGKLDLMAVMIDRPDGCDPDGEGEFLKFADRYLASLGLGDLPIGKAEELALDRLPQWVFNPYWTLIYSNNVMGVGVPLPANRTDDQIKDLTGAVALYRRLLADAPERSVVICSTGFLTNLKELMASGIYYNGDDINFTGMELIAAKVKELRIMAGCFDYTTSPDGLNGAEYNAAGDPIAAKTVLEQWPTPVVVSPWEVGLKLEYKPEDVLADFPAVGTFDPVLRAAYVYWPEPIREGDMNRLWDPMTVLPLTEGDMLVPLSGCGRISVDENGVTAFVADPSGDRCYQDASKMDADKVLERIREICRTGNTPPVSIVPGEPVVFDTALAASNAMAVAVFELRAEVAAALGSDEARRKYRDMFELAVEPTSEGKWAVAAFLRPPDWTNVVMSARSATRQIPVAKIAALELGEVLEDVPLTNCVPGFYYSLYDGVSVTNLKANVNAANCNILCGPNTTVVIPVLPKPSSEAGFFSIGVLESPAVMAGGDLRAPIPPPALCRILATGLDPSSTPGTILAQFDISAKTISGKIAILSEKGEIGKIGENLRVTLMGSMTAGGNFEDIFLMSVNSEGSFSVERPKEYDFFKIRIEILEVVK